MKIWCKHCDDFPEGLCAYCGGDGYTDPPQQILDDLECAEIEREVLSKFKFIDISSFSDLVRVRIGNGEEVLCEFYRTTKLEALRKAKEWIEGRV